MHGRRGPAERRDAVASNTTLHYTIAKHGPELIYMMCRFSWRQNAEPSTLFGLVYYECRLLTGLRTFSCLRFRAAVASDEQQQQKKNPAFFQLADYLEKLEWPYNRRVLVCFLIFFYFKPLQTAL